MLPLRIFCLLRRSDQIMCIWQSGYRCCRAGRYQERGRQTTSAFAGQLEVLAQAMPQMCCAMYVQAASHLRQVRYNHLTAAE